MQAVFLSNVFNWLAMDLEECVLWFCDAMAGFDPVLSDDPTAAAGAAAAAIVGANSMRNLGKENAGVNGPKTNKRTKTYQTYVKVNAETGQVYVGRTSGYGTPEQNLKNRNRKHAWTKAGYGPPVLDRSSANYAAIRGREQQLMDYYSRIGLTATRVNSKGKEVSQIRGISRTNPRLAGYLRAGMNAFGRP